MIANVTPPIPGPTRLANPNRSPGRDAIYTLSINYTVLGLSLTVLSQSYTCTCSIKIISVITKIILYIQKNYHRSGVHKNLYTYTESHFLYKYSYIYNFYYKTSEIAEAALVSTYL